MRFLRNQRVYMVFLLEWTTCPFSLQDVPAHVMYSWQKPTTGGRLLSRPLFGSAVIIVVGAVPCVPHWAGKQTQPEEGRANNKNIQNGHRGPVLFVPYFSRASLALIKLYLTRCSNSCMRFLYSSILYRSASSCCLCFSFCSFSCSSTLLVD